MENSNKNTIQEFFRKIKNLENKRVLYILIMWIVGLIILFIFYFNTRTENLYFVNNSNNFEILYPKDYQERLEPKETKPEEARYLASLNGKNYYPINCKSGNRIKEENKIYFKTESEALAQGLSRSKTCSFPKP